MARSPLTEMISKLSALAEQIHALPEDERNYLLDLLLPEQEAAPAKGKRKRKKYVTGKSTRAQSLATAISSTPKPHLGDGPACGIRAHPENYEDHAQPSPHYHEFQPSKRGEVKMPALPTDGEKAATATGD